VNFISNDAERFLHKVLGISNLKYRWQVTTSILLVLKSFMKKRLTTIMINY